MSKKLIIVESPAKAKTIKKILGKNFDVIASVGHIRDLPKSRMAVDIENNYEPEYINIRGKGQLIKELKKAAKSADKVLLATDPDREGEAISWHLSHILDLSLEDKNRIVFNEITKDAVKNGVGNPRQIDINYVDAQQGRRIMDRLVGYTISPLLWQKVKSGLSAGRVQSVVLKLICDRENEIRNFVPEKYWEINGELKSGSVKFETSYYGELVEGKPEKKKISNKKEAEKIVEDSLKGNFKVHDVSIQKKSLSPKPPFITSTLQREASTRLNFSTKKTMQIAQKLYEGINLGKMGTIGLITYMRTDSTRISNEALNSAGNFILEKYGSKFYNGPRIYKSKNSSQDAHECIRPTLIKTEPKEIKEYLSSDEYKLYSLIWNKFIASQMSDYIYELKSVDFSTSKYVYKSSGENLVFEGFMKVYSDELKKRLEKKLPELANNSKVECLNIYFEEKETQGPSRYTEASLIKTLESLGIGRPSTYSPTISTVLARSYAKLEKKSFVPTSLGEHVNDILTEYFQTLVNEEFTAQFENELDKVEMGEISWRKVVDTYYKELEKDLEKAEKEIAKVKPDQPVKTDIICDKCGAYMVIRHGKYGDFLACSKFPECKNTKSIDDNIGIKCPKCKTGDIVRKRNKKGRYFYGCNRYPDCDFASNNEPSGEFCKECGEPLFVKNRSSKRELVCLNPSCKENTSIKF